MERLTLLESKGSTFITEEQAMQFFKLMVMVPGLQEVHHHLKNRADHLTLTFNSYYSSEHL
jgi:hypothetical protein